MTGGYPWARRDQRPLLSLTTSTNQTPGSTPVRLSSNQPDAGLLIFRFSYRMSSITLPAFDATKPLIVIPLIGAKVPSMSNDPNNWIDYFTTTALGNPFFSFHFHTEPRRPYYVPPGQAFGLLRTGALNYSGDEVIRIEYGEVDV